MEPREFTFKFMVMTVRATVGEQELRVKIGPRTLKAPIDALRFLYVIDHENVGHELLLAYEKAPGKLKRIRFNSNFGEAQFDALIQALLQLRPEIDIRHLPNHEAHQKMGATNFVRMAPFIAIPLILAGMAVFVMPWLLHGLDGGQATVDVRELASAEPDLPSHNLVVTGGRLLWDQGVRKETTGRQSGTKVEFLLPLVPDDWKPGDPVHVVVRTPELDATSAEALAAADRIEGTLRNVMWEGLGGDETEFFRQQQGLALSEHAVELEMGADRSLELYLAIGILVFTLVVLLIVAWIVERRRRRKEAQATA